MSHPTYLWRQLTSAQRERLLSWRKWTELPWHSPPHRPNYGHCHFQITAACYEHQPHIGWSPERLESFSGSLQSALMEQCERIVAWCVLPNHYHALVETKNVIRVLHYLGRFHGRTSHAWNGEEQTRGRQVFHRATERYMRTERHFWATINYIHHNPIHHRYVNRWRDWPWSSAAEFLRQMGWEAAKQIWKEYSLRDYGKGWDDPDF